MSFFIFFLMYSLSRCMCAEKGLLLWQWPSTQLSAKSHFICMQIFQFEVILLCKWYIWWRWKRNKLKMLTIALAIITFYQSPSSIFVIKSSVDKKNIFLSQLSIICNWCSVTKEYSGLLLQCNYKSNSQNSWNSTQSR